MIIVLFHVLYIFGRFVYEKYRQNTKKSSNVCVSSREWTDPESPDALVDYDAPRAPKFSPPAYLQRYVTVQRVLSDAKYEEKLRKVVDYGCSELGFLAHLKRTPGVEQILCIDIDRCVLEANMWRARPLNAEYICCRTNPLCVELYEGSIVDRDKRLEKTDAVICIELIEHLYPDALMDFPFNVFGYIKPRVVIVTTPNAEFNVLFPDLSGFRHADHKFEWTRQQFQDWAENIVLRYPQYSVTFYGICDGPPGTEHLGSCTQMAVFDRIANIDDMPVFGIEGLLKLVLSQEFPYKMDNRSDEQKILDEAVYQIRRITFADEDAMDEVPLQRLLESLKKCNVSLESLRTILVEGGWVVEDHENGPVVLIPPVSTFSDTSNAENPYFDFDDRDFDDREDQGGSDDPWDDEPGPAIGYVDPVLEQERAQFFDNWARENENNHRNESWDEEPSIVIPQSNSIVQDNTYLFDGEHASALHENMSSTDALALNESTSSRIIREDINHDSVPESFCENREINDLRSISFSPIERHRRDVKDSDNCSCNGETTDSPILNESIESASAISGIVSEIDDMDAVDTAVPHTMEPRVKRSLEFQAYISSVRSATLPEPFLSDSICVNKLPYDTTLDSEIDAMHHSMLNNTFRNFDGSTLANATNDDAQQDEIDATVAPATIVQNTAITSSDCDNTCTDPRCKSNADLSKSLTTIDINSVENYNCSKTSKENVPINVQSIEQCDNSDAFTSTTLPRYASSPRATVKSERIKTVKTEKLPPNKLNDVPVKSISQEDTVTNLSKNSMLTSKEQVDAVETDKAKVTSESTVEKSQNVSAISLDKRSTVNLSIDISQIKINSDQRETKADRVRDAASVVAQASDPETKKAENLTNVSSNECAKEFTCPSTCIPTTDKEHTISIPSTLFKSKDKTGSTKKRDSLEDIRSRYESGHIEAKEESPEILETPPNSWSPEIMDSGYPNSASAQDITPEYDLSSIAQDRISDAESPSVAEPPRLGFVEPLEVENGDLANNNRDGEGNNMIAVEANRLEDLQPLIDVLENDMENENDIYALENGFPIWLLRILEMANPLDLEAAHHDFRLYQAPDLAEERDEGCARLDQDEGFKSSSFENDSDTDAENVIEMENDTVDDDDSENENGNEDENDVQKNVDVVDEAGIKT